MHVVRLNESNVGPVKMRIARVFHGVHLCECVSLFVSGCTAWACVGLSREADPRSLGTIRSHFFPLLHRSFIVLSGVVDFLFRRRPFLIWLPQGSMMIAFDACLCNNGGTELFGNGNHDGLCPVLSVAHICQRSSLHIYYNLHTLEPR